jgi:hypothetical protein
VCCSVPEEDSHATLRCVSMCMCGTAPEGGWPDQAHEQQVHAASYSSGERGVRGSVTGISKMGGRACL